MNSNGTGVGDMPHDDLVRKLRTEWPVGPGNRVAVQVMDQAATRIEALEAQLAEAVEALRPFATAMEWALEGTTSQTLGTIEAVAKYHLVGGSFNRARAALATITGDKP